jgi:signal transduction histidine kinase
MSEVAHEIKSPLAVMIGYADLLRFDAVNLGSDQREYATAIEKSARQLAVLIDDLSDITNIESGHFTTAKEPHNVMKVISSVTDGLKVSDPDIDRRLTVSDSLFDFEVEGDPARLSQVFTNLISNALKYSDGDQPVEVSTVKTENNSVRISIIDRGLGIAEEDVEKLFTPYFRSMNPEATQRPGTGLGLFLSRSIIEQHGGTLTLSTQVGIGSTFTVELPSSLNTPLADAA